LKTPQHITYFNVQAALGRKYLHPGGQWATEKLLALLPVLDSGSTVLEIGCGLGATAVMLLDRFPCSYVGLDSSPKMVKKSRRLLRAYESRVRIIECDLFKEDFPVASGSVEAVIAESVLAILDPIRITNECHRVLRRKGVLALNERIWGSSVGPSERRRLNELAENLYGFPFASEALATAGEWEAAMEEAGFKMARTEKLELSQLPESERTVEHPGMPQKLWLALFHPSIFRAQYHDRSIAREYADVWTSMENWIFVAEKV